MTWTRVASGIYASHPSEVEAPLRVVAGLQEIVALMREPDSEPAIIVTNVAGGSAVSTIIRRAKAIVSTIGGPNSHIVVVARDYSMPCIVGAADLDLTTLANGTMMRMRADGTIEIAGADNVAAQPPLAQMQVLRSIAFAGAVGDQSEIIGFGDDLGSTFAALAVEGLIENEGYIAPTEAGMKALDAWYAADRAGIDEAARDALIAAFRPLDLEIKRLATAWQDAEGRDDWDARLKVVEDLSALHDRTLAFLGANAATLKRFHEYAERLTRAHERVVDGDTDFIASVRIDSYHTVWFTMHEDLLRLLERERDPE